MTTKTATAAVPKLDIDATRERLLRVGLAQAAEELDRHLSESVKGNASPHRFLDRLLEDELHHREERRIRTSLVLSGLPTGQTLANFDFSFQPSIERSRIETLATCQWIRENRTLLIQGPPGVGKSQLAAALGVRLWNTGSGSSSTGSMSCSLSSAVMPTSRRPDCGGRSTSRPRFSSSTRWASNR